MTIQIVSIQKFQTLKANRAKLMNENSEAQNEYLFANICKTSFKRMRSWNIVTAQLQTQPRQKKQQLR